MPACHTDLIFSKLYERTNSESFHTEPFNLCRHVECIGHTLILLYMHALPSLFTVDSNFAISKPWQTSMCLELFTFLPQQWWLVHTWEANNLLWPCSHSAITPISSDLIKNWTVSNASQPSWKRISVLLQGGLPAVIFHICVMHDGYCSESTLMGAKKVQL